MAGTGVNKFPFTSSTYYEVLSNAETLPAPPPPPLSFDVHPTVKGLSTQGLFDGTMLYWIGMHALSVETPTQAHFEIVCNLYKNLELPLGEKLVRILATLQHALENPNPRRDTATSESYKNLHISLCKRFSSAFVDGETLEAKTLKFRKLPFDMLSTKQAEYIADAANRTDALPLFAVEIVTEAQARAGAGAGAGTGAAEPIEALPERPTEECKDVVKAEKEIFLRVARYVLAEGNMNTRTLCSIRYALRHRLLDEKKISNANAIWTVQWILHRALRDKTSASRDDSTDQLYRQLEAVLYQVGYPESALRREFQHQFNEKLVSAAKAYITTTYQRSDGLDLVSLSNESYINERFDRVMREWIGQHALATGDTTQQNFTRILGVFAHRDLETGQKLTYILALLQDAMERPSSSRTKETQASYERLGAQLLTEFLLALSGEQPLLPCVKTLRHCATFFNDFGVDLAATAREKHTGSSVGAGASAGSVDAHSTTYATVLAPSASSRRDDAVPPPCIDFDRAQSTLYTRVGNYVLDGGDLKTNTFSHLQRAFNFAPAGTLTPEKLLDIQVQLQVVLYCSYYGTTGRSQRTDAFYRHLTAELAPHGWPRARITSEYQARSNRLAASYRAAAEAAAMYY